MILVQFDPGCIMAAATFEEIDAPGLIDAILDHLFVLTYLFWHVTMWIGLSKLLVSLSGPFNLSTYILDQLVLLIESLVDQFCAHLLYNDVLE